MISPDVLFREYQNSEKNPVFLLYRGGFSQSTLVELGNIVRRRIGFDGKAKRIFSVFIELTQNINNYSVDTEEDKETGRKAGVGIIAVSDTTTEYIVHAGNTIYTNNVHKMNQLCTLIHYMSNEQLRTLQREKIREGPLPDSKGAGLGLIDISIKTNKNVEFGFAPIDEMYTFFHVTAMVKKQSLI